MGPLVPERTNRRVWNRSGERQSANDTTTRTKAARPISPLPLAQTREKMAELLGMVSTLIDKSQNQEIAYRTISNRLEQPKENSPRIVPNV